MPTGQNPDSKLEDAEETHRKRVGLSVDRGNVSSSSEMKVEKSMEKKGRRGGKGGFI